MRTLVKNKKKNKFFSSTIVRFLINSFLLLSSLVIIYFSVTWVQRKQNARIDLAKKRAETLLHVVVDDVSRAVGAVRNSMDLIAKMPVLRKFKKVGALKPIITEKKNELINLVSIYEPYFGYAYQEYLLSRKNMNYLSEIPGALGRRILFNTNFLKSDEEEPNLFEPPEPIKEDKYSLFVKRTSFAENIKDRLQNNIEATFEKFEDIAGRIDKLLGISVDVLSDPADAENLLAACMNYRDLILSYSASNLDGQIQAEVAENDSPFGMGNSAAFFGHKKGQKFYSGPAIYDEKSKQPLWSVSVPLRDRNRKQMGYLSSLVSLKFLSKISEKCSFRKGVTLFFVDNEGIAIGHPDKSMVINQINMTHANPAVKNVIAGEKASLLAEVNGKDYVLSYGPLNSFDSPQNPEWGVIIMATVSELSGSIVIMMTLGVIILAAIGVYVLFYVSGQLMYLLDEENEI